MEITQATADQHTTIIRCRLICSCCDVVGLVFVDQVEFEFADQSLKHKIILQVGLVVILFYMN